MGERKRSRLIEMLLEQEAVTEVQLNRAKAGINTNCEAFSLISAGFISDVQVTAFITKHARVPFIELTECSLDGEILSLVPEEYCALNCCIPISKLVNSISVAMVDPLDEHLAGELHEMTKMSIRPVLCSLRAFQDTMKTAWISLREEEEEEEEIGEANAQADTVRL